MKKSLIVLLCTAALGLAGSSAVFAASDQTKGPMDPRPATAGVSQPSAERGGVVVVSKIPKRMVPKSKKQASEELARQNKQLNAINKSILSIKGQLRSDNLTTKNRNSLNNRLTLLQDHQTAHQHRIGYLKHFINPKSDKQTKMSQNGSPYHQRNQMYDGYHDNSGSRYGAGSGSGMP